MHTDWEQNLISLASHRDNPAADHASSAWADTHLLHQANREAETITAAHSKSFFLASSLLPPEKRTAVRALYAFCRTVDDIVDESSGDDRAEKLTKWRQMIHSNYAPAGNPVAAAWLNASTRFRIPRHYALQLIDGVARDLTQTRYQTFEDLTMYCYGVASTVGLMSMHIIGFDSREAVPYAIKLGVALQMTNILRDVGEDFQQGRIYLPREEMLAYGLSESEIQTGSVTPRWRQFMKFQIQRARQLYQESWAGIKMLNRDGQMAIGAASVFYQGILNDIEKHDYNVFTRRASLNAFGKLSRIPSLWLKVKSL